MCVRAHSLLPKLVLEIDNGDVVGIAEALFETRRAEGGNELSERPGE